ncbi:hypothetical protein HDU98_001148 [Podochytrium sp. JEL0797]|nr:hypothetical protein HDU98_001148 [Podochytrium sp. JEL0797]
MRGGMNRGPPRSNPQAHYHNTNPTNYTTNYSNTNPAMDLDYEQPRTRQPPQQRQLASVLSIKNLHFSTTAQDLHDVVIHLDQNKTPNLKSNLPLPKLEYDQADRSTGSALWSIQDHGLAVRVAHLLNGEVFDGVSIIATVLSAAGSVQKVPVRPNAPLQQQGYAPVQGFQQGGVQGGSYQQQQLAHQNNINNNQIRNLQRNAGVQKKKPVLARLGPPTVLMRLGPKKEEILARLGPKTGGPTILGRLGAKMDQVIDPASQPTLTVQRATPESLSSSESVPHIPHPARQRLGSHGSSSHRTHSSNSRDEHPEYAPLWDELAAVFGEAIIEGREGVVEDEGTLFIAPTHLFFIPTLHQNTSTSSTTTTTPISTEISPVSLARTKSLQQKFKSKRLSLAQTGKPDTSESTTTPPTSPRTSLDNPPPPIDVTRRRSLFTRRESTTTPPPPRTATHFHLPIPHITSISKTRTNPVLLHPNALLIESRNTQENVLSHTRKDVFSGFPGTLRLIDLEKRVLSNVDVYRESVGDQAGGSGGKESGSTSVKKKIKRRPSVGTSALYTALVGKGADDFMHLTSDLAKGEGKVDGPKSIKMAVSKSLQGRKGESVSTPVPTPPITAKSKLNAMNEPDSGYSTPTGTPALRNATPSKPAPSSLQQRKFNRMLSENSSSSREDFLVPPRRMASRTTSLDLHPQVSNQEVTVVSIQGTQFRVDFERLVDVLVVVVGVAVVGVVVVDFVLIVGILV